MEPAICFQDLSAMGDQIRVCEIEDGLSLYHYKTCTKDSDNLLKQVRGIVFDANNNLIMRGFPYTQEFIASDNLSTELNVNLKDFRTFASFEGTIIRVFFYNKWYVSTHKKLNAMNSYWAGDESFEEIFRRGVENVINTTEFKTDFVDYESFFNTLDKSKQYMFLVTPTADTRIVSIGRGPTVFHVGTFVNNVFTMDESIGFPRPSELFFNCIDELSKYVSGQNPLYLQGVILMGQSGFYKVVNNAYAVLAEIRGNQPSLAMRYIELKRDKDPNLAYFCNMYADKTDLFKNIELRLFEIARNVHNVYMQRFIHKKFAVVTPERYSILKKCHNFYKTHRQPITFEIVYMILLQQKPRFIVKLV